MVKSPPSIEPESLTEAKDSPPHLEPDLPPSEGDETESSPGALEQGSPSPSSADGVLHPLDPRYRDAERLGGRIFMLIAGVVGLGVCGWAWMAEWFTPAVRVVCLVALPFVLYGFYRLGLLYTELELRRTRYRLTDDTLEIRRGVVWRHIVHVPRSRMQHTDVTQGPVQRRFEIATLTVHTAGTEHAAVALAGISHAEALAVRDSLILSTGNEAAGGEPSAGDHDEFEVADAGSFEDSPSCDAEFDAGAADAPHEAAESRSRTTPPPPSPPRTEGPT